MWPVSHTHLTLPTNSRDMTMVIVTHEINFAHDVADRTIFMADGLIVEEGLAHDLVNAPSNDRTRAFLSNIMK